MTAFLFVAVRPDDGASVRGRLEAASSREATDLLVRRGLVPVSVDLLPPEAAATRPLPVRVQATALRMLATLVEAGVPLAPALRLTRQSSEPRLADPLERVETRVREGACCAAALEAEGMFSPVIIGLLRAAEGGGGLASGLERSADELERQAEVTARLHAALAYPLVLVLVGAASITAIAALVVPRFAVLLADVEVVLPWSTRALLAGSALLRHHAVAAMVVSALALMAGWHQLAAHRSRWHGWLLAIPMVGGVRHALATARAARTLAALLDVGAPALTALRLATGAAGDDAVGARLFAASTRVAEGAAFSSALEAEHAFTPLAVQLARIGEDAGRLPEMLRRAAVIEQNAAERRIRSAVALIEPATIVGFALLVAFVAGALLQAVYSVRAGSL